ncbi:MAG: hypothetical protein IJ590_02815 [Rickettsiales bacterium]|nr:hypothetical protein [Rickettsiales bacterium]
MSCCCGGESYAEKKAKKNKSRQLAQDQDVMSGTFVGNNSNNGGNYQYNEYLKSQGNINFVYNCGEAPAAGGKYLNKINLFPKGNTNYYQKHNGVDSRGNKMNINNNDKMGLPTWSIICKYQPESIFGKTTILQEEKSQCSTNSLPSKPAVNNKKTPNDKNQTEVLIKEIDNLNRMTCNSINSINSIKNNHFGNTRIFERINFNDNNEINNNDVKNEFPSYSELQSQYGNDTNSNKINSSKPKTVFIGQNNKQCLIKAPLASHINKAKAPECFWKEQSDNETSSNNDPLRKCIVINKGTNTIKKLLSKQNNIKFL